MHFATKFVSDENKEYHNWHCMPFKEDFDKKLMKYGQLPISSMKEHFNMMQEVQKKEKQIKDLEQELELQKKNTRLI